MTITIDESKLYLPSLKTGNTVLDTMFKEAAISLHGHRITEQKRKKRIDDMFDLFEWLPGAFKGADIHDGTKLQEVMTTGDFPFAIGEFVNRRVVEGYSRKMFNFEPLVWNDTVPNFLPVTRYQNREGLDDLEYVAEKGQMRPGYVSDATKRQYKVHKWGKQYDFSMEALINDDLGYFDDVIPKMGETARRSLEKFVSRMYTNATSIARLVALGALYSQNGRLTSARISEARMGFNQRLDGRAEPILASLRYLVHHPGLADAVYQIQNSTLVPELATNGVNVVANNTPGRFIAIEDPYLPGAAPNLPWYGFTAPAQLKGIVLARMRGFPGPMIMRKKSDIEFVGSLTGAGQAAPPMMGSFATQNLVFGVMDIYGTYVDGTEGSLFDTNGLYYSSGTVP